MFCAAIAAVALLAAACGGDDDNGDETPAQSASVVATQAAETPQATVSASTGEATSTSGASDTTPDPSGGTVQLGAEGLVDSGGFSLYVFASDTAGSGTSACVGGCASAWPPLLSEGEPTAGAGVTGELGTITRDTGMQVTYKGLPLYRWINDSEPGDTTGRDIANWSLAQP
jgi:predicted lipoprotein with Yx(FWY)xxD motif